jgi:hypothetical protein
MAKALLLKDLQVMYEQEILLGGRSSTFHTVGRELAPIQDFFGDWRPGDIFKANVQEFVDAMSKNFKEGKIAEHLRRGRAFYNWLEAHEYVEFNHNPFTRWLKEHTWYGNKKPSLESPK